jgi:hypothetical protein
MRLFQKLNDEGTTIVQVTHSRRTRGTATGSSACVTAGSRARRSSPSASASARSREDAMSSWIHDARLAIAGLARSRGFTAVALATLALGIGAERRVFSVGRRRPPSAPPLRRSRRLVAVGDQNPSGGSPDNVGYKTYEDLRDRNTTFESMAAIRFWQPTLIADGRAERNSRDARQLELLLDARRAAGARPRLPGWRTTGRTAVACSFSRTRSGGAASARTRRSSVDRCG